MSFRHFVDDRRVPTETSCGTATNCGYYYSVLSSGSNDPKRATPQNYSKIVTVVDDPLITWQYPIDGLHDDTVRTGTFGLCFGHGSPGFVDPVIDGNTKIDLINRTYEKMKSHRFNAAVSLGEARESLMMIGSTSRQLAGAMIQLKRGNVAGSWNTLLGGNPYKKKPPAIVTNPASPNYLSNAWLALQYGWLPLVGEVCNAANAASAHFNKPVKSRFSSTYKSSGSLGERYDGVNDISQKLTWIVEEEPSEIAQLGFYDPSLVAWELLPYSFVADWFLPIGSYLEARSCLGRMRGTAITTTKA